MIPGRMGGQVSPDMTFPQACNSIAGATKLECAGPLQMFTLEEKPAVQVGIERGLIEDRGLPNLVADARVGQMNINDVRDVFCLSHLIAKAGMRQFKNKADPVKLVYLHLITHLISITIN